MANNVDLHIGKQIRRRRRLLGLTQEQLGDAINARFQRVHAYESAANRVPASELYEIALALKVPVQYFFEGLAVVSTQQQG